MNRPDDAFDLHDHLSRAIGDEPPMASRPEDDTARGRRMLRRRRLTAVATSAAVVPALALGGWAVSSSLGSDEGSGHRVIRPAGSPSDTAGPSTDPSAADCAVVSVAPAPSDDSGSGQAGGGGGNDGTIGSSSSGDATLCAISDVPGDLGSCDAVPYDDGGGTAATVEVLPGTGGYEGFLSPSDANGSAQSGGDTVTPMPGDGTLEPADGDATLTATCVDGGDGGDLSSRALDRVQAALESNLDPSGDHLQSSIVGGTVAEGDSPTGIYVGAVWVEGDREGMVSLSVEYKTTAGEGCLDTSIAMGPDVSCEKQTLSDGITVWVGRGTQDGAERLAVRFARPDGSVVWATADQAGEQFWTDGTGAAPLTQLPVTLDQLITFAQDSDVHL